MADGELCKHCGWQETDHKYKGEQESPHRRKEGYRISLLRCRGFVSEETREDDPEDSRFVIAYWERQAAGAAAWGAYAADVRQQNFNRELAARNKAMSGASSERREDLKRERDAWVGRCKSDNTMHIGPF